MFSDKSVQAPYLTDNIIEQTLLHIKVEVGVVDATTLNDIKLPALSFYLPDQLSSEVFPIYSGDDVVLDQDEVINNEKVQGESDISLVVKYGKSVVFMKSMLLQVGFILITCM